ncbi:MAG: GTPase [Candidatus Dadabacteria bacterium]|nr:GTPase [Candidatus Dadabacteria bacterium]NIQ16935.1 GTPase [Candidatus Dadabacteria bacterium]
MKIVFVYNADSGKINSILDCAHKIVSPSTYKCSLCSLTHNAFNEKSEWSKFRKSTGHELVFLHKDEYESRFNSKFEYPVILDVTNETKVLISSADLKKFENVKDLISAVEKVTS